MVAKQMQFFFFLNKTEWARLLPGWLAGGLGFGTGAAAACCQTYTHTTWESYITATPNKPQKDAFVGLRLFTFDKTVPTVVCAQHIHLKMIVLCIDVSELQLYFLELMK